MAIYTDDRGTVDFGYRPNAADISSYMSGASGGILGTLGAIGGAVSPFMPLIGLGVNALGSLLGEDPAKAQLEQRQAELEENKRQFNQRYALDREAQNNANTSATQNVGTTGLNALAAQRLQASKLQTFRDALRKAAASQQAGA